MVFLIQNTRNRDAKATQLKLDELIRAIGDVRNQFIGAEAEPEEQIEREKRAVETEKSKPLDPTEFERRDAPRSHNRTPHDGEPAGRR